MASGHLEKRSKDGWTIIIDYGYQQDPVTGKVKEVRKPYSFRHVTKKWAAQKMHDMLSEINKGSFVEPAETRLGEYLWTWLENTAAPRVAKRTYGGYKTIIEKHVEPTLGPVRLSEVTPDNLRVLYVQLGQKGLCASSIRRVHVLLHSALGQALTDGKVYRNIADAVKPPKEEAAERVALTREQVETVLAAAKAMGKPRPRFKEWLCTVHDLLYVALNTGMRRGELLALRWQEVDLEAGLIRVERTMNKDKGEIEVKAPKSKKSRRQIPITKEVASYLQDLRSRNPHGLVFCYDDGSYLDPSTVSHIFSRLADRIGVDEATFHSQRHTYVTRLIETGADPFTVQELAGHASVTTTRVYVHTLDERKRQAVEKMSKPRKKTRAQQSRSKSPEKQETQPCDWADILVGHKGLEPLTTRLRVGWQGFL